MGDGAARVRVERGFEVGGGAGQVSEQATQAASPRQAEGVLRPARRRQRRAQLRMEQLAKIPKLAIRRMRQAEADAEILQLLIGPQRGQQLERLHSFMPLCLQEDADALPLLRVEQIREALIDRPIVDQNIGETSAPAADLGAQHVGPAQVRGDDQGLLDGGVGQRQLPQRQACLRLQVIALGMASFGSLRLQDVRQGFLGAPRLQQEPGAQVVGPEHLALRSDDRVEQRRPASAGLRQYASASQPWRIMSLG